MTFSVSGESNGFSQSMAPDLRKRVDEQRAQRLALEASMKNQNAAAVRFTTLISPMAISPSRLVVVVLVGGAGIESSQGNFTSSLRVLNSPG